MRRVLPSLAIAMAVVCAMPAHAGDVWTKPTSEELKMTDLPGHPGVPAVILNREEITRDDMHSVQHYERIKILTEKGKEYANVELRFAASRDDGWYSGDEKNITDIQGRTVHPDGTVVPFTGKPFLKTFEKNREYSYQARVFTLPDVEVGSIIEYRYAIRIADNIFESPHWYVQGELYTKNAHFAWYPTTHELMSSSEDGMVNTIAWFPILPSGTAVQRRESPVASGGGGGTQQSFDLVVHDVAPQASEEYMPPMASFSYRVLFYYTGYHTAAEFWRVSGKKWAKSFDSFAGPDAALTAATQAVTEGAATPEAKLRKIYAKVMSLENSDFSRTHGQREDQLAGIGKVSSAVDILKRERGSSAQLTKLFVGMARASGMKAYGMLVPNREHRLFTPGWLSMGQFDNELAIVVMDGKERFFDPGSRYAPFGELSWQSTFVQGLRETDGGNTDFAQTPGQAYVANKTQRVGDLTVDEHGEVHGTLTLTYLGSTALAWRQRALRGDEESVRHGLRTAMESMVPKTVDVKVASIENLKEYDKPLVVKYDVKGIAGTPTSKRMILPADIFLADSGTSFPHEKRETPVYFHYAQMIQDAVRIKYPVTLAVEAVPAETSTMFQTLGKYSLSLSQAANSITVRRNYIFNSVIIPTKDYGELRTFYAAMESKDKDSIVLKMGSPAPPTAAPAGN